MNASTLALFLIGAPLAVANSYVVDEHALFVRTARNGNYLLRFEPVKGKELRTVSVFSYEPRAQDYVRATEYTTGNRYDWYILVENDGTTLYLNPRLDPENLSAPVFEVIAKDGRIIDSKRLTDLLESREVAALESAAREAAKKNYIFEWFISFAEVHGRYWLELNEAGVLPNGKYFGKYLFLSPLSWCFSRASVAKTNAANDSGDSTEEIVSRPPK